MIMLPTGLPTGPRKAFEPLSRAEAQTLQPGAAVHYVRTHYALRRDPETRKMGLAGCAVAHSAEVKSVKRAVGGRVQVRLKNGPVVHSDDLEAGRLLREIDTVSGPVSKLQAA